ncbi:MAG TPA: HDOD domain-containing protein [Nitrospirae bacterium]|nr:HDOD domain-containing protein [Nitrospirota bacterium]
MTEDKNAVREAVLKKIRQNSDFPAMSSTVSLINKFDPKDDISITDFANLILKDIAFTTKILKVVNSVNYMQFGEVTTISRAIILIGFENIKNLAVTLILFDQLQKHKSNSALMDSVTKSLYSAILARKIAEETGFASKEESFLCSIFHIFGKMLVSFSMPEKVEEIDMFMKQHNCSETIAAISILGISYEDIGVNIAKEWNLPKKIVSCMKKIMPSELSENQGEIDKLRSISTFTHNITNIIAKESATDEREAAINKNLSLFKVHFNVIQSKIKQLLKESDKEFIEFFNMFKIDLRTSRFAINLLNLKNDEPAKSAEIKQSKEFVLPSSIESFDEILESESFENPETIFRKGIQEINKSLLSGFNLNDIIRVVLETMFRGLQLTGKSKVLFIVRDTRRPVMTVRYGFGNAISETKQWFEIVIDNSNDIFNISINNQKDFVIKKLSSPDIISMLPSWFIQRINQDEFIILLPIVVNELTIGIYYIEGQQEELSKISSMHLNNLKILRDQTVMAIKQQRGF